jgi:hypothetical protein
MFYAPHWMQKKSVKIYCTCLLRGILKIGRNIKEKTKNAVNDLLNNKTAKKLKPTTPLQKIFILFYRP